MKRLYFIFRLRDQHNRYITRVQVSVEHREDGAVREVMNRAASERGLHGSLKILSHGLLKTCGKPAVHE